MTYLSDSEKYTHLARLIKPFCHWNIKLNSPSNYQIRYCDWLECRVEGFFPYLKSLMTLSKDEEFYFYDLDSVPEEEFYRLFGKYPIVEMKVEIDENDYISSLNVEPGVKIPGRIYAVADTSTYAIFPESMNWHIYGEYDIELARLVSKVGLPPDSLFPCEFYTEEEAMARIKLLDTRIPEPPP